MKRIHNKPHEMIQAFHDARCLVVLSDKGITYLYQNDGAVVDVVASALNDPEFAQYAARAIDQNRSANG